MKGMLVGAIISGAMLSSGCMMITRRDILDSSFQANRVEPHNVFVYAEGESIPEHTRVAILAADGTTLGNEDETSAELRDRLREAVPTVVEGS